MVVVGVRNAWWLLLAIGGPVIGILTHGIGGLAFGDWFWWLVTVWLSSVLHLVVDCGVWCVDQWLMTWWSVCVIGAVGVT